MSSVPPPTAPMPLMVAPTAMEARAVHTAPMAAPPSQRDAQALEGSRVRIQDADGIVRPAWRLPCARRVPLGAAARRARVSAGPRARWL